MLSLLGVIVFILCQMCMYIGMKLFSNYAVPRKSDFSLDTELIAEVVEQERPKCMFLTSPNNPDGRLLFLAFYDLIFLDDAIGLMLSMFNCTVLACFALSLH